MAKLWGGRFEKETDQAVEAFTASIGVDARLWEVDIRASQAHARMLGKCGVIPAAEAETLVNGLESVHEAIRSGEVEFSLVAEDIHSEIERLLTDKVGTVAGKLHSARSRNDQVATDTRLYLREQCDAFSAELKSLQKLLIGLAEPHLETILPGLTHLQHAQPVSLAHHLLAYFWMFQRDVERLSDARARINVLPLGSAALAGTSFPLDRKMVAKELGFDRVTENSLDAVSDRDFVVEFLSASALVATHLSRMAEELIVWSAPEFGFIELDDAVATGSSIMPQKKNPDVAELIRGRTGRVTASLMGALTMLKALPLSYNRDLQEDKTFLFEGLDTAVACTRLMALMLSSAKFRTEKMRAALAGDFSNATDLADDLARKGLPFRQAHEVIGRIVRHCIESEKALEALTLSELKKFSPLFDEQSMKLIPHDAVMKARKTEGGTSPESVRAQLATARECLKK